MQRKFYSSLFILILANLLVKPISLFVIDAGFQNELGHVDYGLYFSLLNFSLLFNILLDFGINNFTTRRVAQNPNKAKRLFGIIFTFRILLFVFYILVISLLAYVIGYRNEALYILFILGLNQFIIMAIAYFRSHFAGFHFFKLDALLSVMDRFLLVVFGSYLLFYADARNTLTIYDFVWLQFITYLISFSIGLILFLKFIDRPKFHWNLKLSFEIIKRSLPYALLIVMMLFYSRIDSVMLERLHYNGAEQTGIYAQGFRLLDAFYMFGMLFAGLLFPIFSRSLKENKSLVAPLLRSSGNLLIGGAIFIALISFYNGEYILSLVYTEYDQAIIPFHWLMISFIAICMNFIFGTLLTASGDLKILIWISFFAILINVTLNSVFIPEFGAKATAINACITHFFAAISQCIYAVKKFSIPITMPDILRYPALICGMFLFGELFGSFEYFLFYQIGFGLMLLFLLSFVHVGMLFQLFNFKENKIK